MLFRCVECAKTTDSDELAPTCETCGSALLREEARSADVSKVDLESLPQGVWRYRGFLPEVRTEDIISLGEGATPLLRAERLGAELGQRNILIKDESRNPTGSFMDRGTTVLVSIAKGRGVKECGCVTTGNLGASLAAYCAKAGMGARIRVNPNTDQGKLYQMLAYGAEIDTALPPAAAKRTLLVTAGNPYLLEGEKTTGFEIVSELGWRAPDVVVVPVGTGGHLSMIWRSFIELSDAGLLKRLDCRLVGVKLEEPYPRARVPSSESLRLAELAESVPFFRKAAEGAIADSHGFSLTISAGETISATGLLAKTEGIFAEPSAASVVAALGRAIKEGRVDRSETVACVITGAGLKDPKAVSRLAKETRRIVAGETYALPSPQIGETKLALLRLLGGAPNYGYELRRELGLERRISTASVYQHLLELEGFGMVRRRGSVTAKGRERVMYEITRRGSEYLRIARQLERSG